MNRDAAEQVLRDYGVLCQPDADPGLAAVRVAILVEDVFGVVLPDADIDPAVLTDPSAVAALVVRLQGAG